MATKYGYIGIIDIFFPLSIFGVFSMPRQPIHKKEPSQGVATESK